MPSWNPDILNRYLAPGIASFTAAPVPELTPEGERVEHWMANHFLNNVFNGHFSGKQRQFAFNIIYRAQACFEAYSEARELTAEFLASGTPHNPKSRLYYKALRRWEACLLNLQIFSDLIVRLSGRKVFEKDDGSPEQRAFGMANTIKHWGQNIAREEHDDNDTVPMWLTNRGFATRESELSYDELASLLHEAAVVVSDLQNPSAWRNADA